MGRNGTWFDSSAEGTDLKICRHFRRNSQIEIVQATKILGFNLNLVKTKMGMPV